MVLISSSLFKKINPLFFIPFIFYYLTAAPDIGLGDTALLIDGIKNLKLNSHVNNHNWTVLIGHLFMQLPMEPLAFKCNLVSVIHASIGIIIFYFILKALSFSRINASLFSGILMVSNSYWWHGTLIECYAANAVFLLLTLLFLIKYNQTSKFYYLYIAFFTSGFAVFNHVQMGTLGIGCVIFLMGILWKNRHNFKAPIKIRLFFICGAFGILGLFPWLFLLFRDMARLPNALKTLKWAFGGDFTGIMWTIRGNPTLKFLEWLFLQFPSPFLLLIPIGIFFILKNKKNYPLAFTLLTIFLMNTVFFMFYKTWDQFAFYLPSFIIAATFGVFGWQYLHQKISALNQKKYQVIAYIIIVFSILYPPYLYANIVRYADEDPDGYWGRNYQNKSCENTHNVAEYIVNPNKRNWKDVQYFANLLFSKLPERSRFIDDDGRTFYPLNYYFQGYYKKRRDLKISLINSWGFSNWGITKKQLIRKITNSKTPVYIVSDKSPHNTYLIELHKSNYRLEKIDLDSHKKIYIFKIVKKEKEEIQNPVFQSLKLQTGLKLYGKNPEYKNSFFPDERIYTKAVFDNLQNQTVAKFLWKNSSGEIIFTSDELFLPYNETAAWSYFNKNINNSILIGEYSVSFRIDDNEIISTNFIITDD
jgi:hypothetical protein